MLSTSENLATNIGLQESPKWGGVVASGVVMTGAGWESWQNCFMVGKKVPFIKTATASGNLPGSTNVSLREFWGEKHTFQNKQ